MGAAMQFSAVTSYLTANVAAIPLLWILPLSVYLITLILAFQFRVLLPWGIIARFMVVMLGAPRLFAFEDQCHLAPVALASSSFSWNCSSPASSAIPRPTGLRPQRASEATLFYLLFAAGGALGSFLIGIAAPLVFSLNLDLPITFLVTALLALAVNWRGVWSQRLLWIVASGAMVVLIFMVRIAYQRDATVTVRNFYASLRVTQTVSYPGTTDRTLMNGIHPARNPDLRRRRTAPHPHHLLLPATPASASPIRFCCPDALPTRPRRIGVIGLGAGTIAAYGRPGDHIRFYDINPAVQPIARNVFTYIRDSGAQIDIVEGDARTSLAHEAPQNFDVLVVDAFSGDAIPIHLLTREALALYRRHLAPGGILAFHISNRHVDLEPPIALLAASAGMQARHVYSLGNDDPGRIFLHLDAGHRQRRISSSSRNSSPTPSFPTPSPASASGPTTTPPSSPSSAGKSALSLWSAAGP